MDLDFQGNSSLKNEIWVSYKNYKEEDDKRLDWSTLSIIVLTNSSIVEWLRCVSFIMNSGIESWFRI